MDWSGLKNCRLENYSWKKCKVEILSWKNVHLSQLFTKTISYLKNYSNYTEVCSSRSVITLFKGIKVHPFNTFFIIFSINLWPDFGWDLVKTTIYQALSCLACLISNVVQDFTLHQWLIVLSKVLRCSCNHSSILPGLDTDNDTSTSTQIYLFINAENGSDARCFIYNVQGHFRFDFGCTDPSISLSRHVGKQLKPLWQSSYLRDM